jgi:twitching motility protein PilT
MEKPRDLDTLVEDLHNSLRRPAGSGQDARLERWLDGAMAEGASDLLLVAGVPPSIRVDGVIRHLPDEPLDGDAIEREILAVLPEHAQRAYSERRMADAALRFRGRRFRVNLHRERNRAAAAIRALPRDVPRLASLNLPAGLEALTRLTRGLVLIGGATGSGKSTTLAALVGEISRRDARHLITIEDPVEYEHAHQRALVEQIEVGLDTPDFPTGLRAALRSAPDVLVIGEMRDPETMRIALAAAETGHLVLSTIHASDVASTVGRIADSFPPERQHTVRQELAMALTAVVVQQLLPRSGGGRVPAPELLMVGYGARQHVRKNALQHLHQEMTLTRRHGSFTFEDSLAGLVRAGLLESADARLAAPHPEELDHILGSPPPA